MSGRGGPEIFEKALDIKDVDIMDQKKITTRPSAIESPSKVILSD